MWLPDDVVARLRRSAAEPQLEGTRYRLVARIGDGAMGTVWRVTDTTLGRDVALKVLSFEDSTGDVAARLQREAQILARLEHPNIVPIYDAGTLPEGRPYYCMRLVEGTTLTRYLESPSTAQQRLRLFLRICDAVAFAHSRGVIHRDLKPDNIMAGAFGEVFVMDWGIAKVAADQTAAALGPLRTHDAAVAGTPGFVAPEQLSGEAARVDERADVYALGRILEASLRGAPGRVPRRLRAIAVKCTAQDREKRYGSVREVAREVVRYLEGEPVEAYRESPAERALRFAVNNKTLMLLIATYVMVRLLIFLLRPA